MGFCFGIGRDWRCGVGQGREAVVAKVGFGGVREGSGSVLRFLGSGRDELGGWVVFERAMGVLITSPKIFGALVSLE